MAIRIPAASCDLFTAAVLARVRTQTAEDGTSLPPAVWAAQHATLISPTHGRRPFSPYPYQTALFEDPAPRRIVLKARQTGLSNAIAIEALHLALTQPHATVLFVSRNQIAARLLVSYCQHVLTGLRQAPALTVENQGQLGFANGSQIVSLPASPATGRGFAATSVYLDEFAFARYDAQIYDSVIGTVAAGGRLTVISTPNGRANMFFRLWQGIEGGDWSRHTVHWQDCPVYTADWGRQRRAEMTAQSFAQEYDCDFLTSGGAVFDSEALARCRDGWQPAAVDCEDYVTAWDIGRRRDHTVGITLGRRGDVWHEAAFERFLAPYPVIQARIEERQRRFGRTLVESNGVGDPVIENLAVPVEPFTTTARTKVQAIQALQLLIEQGRLKFGAGQLDRELSLYQWEDGGLVTDAVIAAAIAAAAIAGAPGPGVWF